MCLYTSCVWLSWQTWPFDPAAKPIMGNPVWCLNLLGCFISSLLPTCFLANCLYVLSLFYQTYIVYISTLLVVFRHTPIFLNLLDQSWTLKEMYWGPIRICKFSGYSSSFQRSYNLSIILLLYKLSTYQWNIDNPIYCGSSNNQKIGIKYCI